MPDEKTIYRLFVEGVGQAVRFAISARFRRHMNKTQTELADWLGVTRQTIANILDGKSARVDHLWALITALNVHLGDFFHDSCPEDSRVSCGKIGYEAPIPCPRDLILHGYAKVLLNWGIESSIGVAEVDFLLCLANAGWGHKTYASGFDSSRVHEEQEKILNTIPEEIRRGRNIEDAERLWTTWGEACLEAITTLVEWTVTPTIVPHHTVKGVFHDHA